MRKQIFILLLISPAFVNAQIEHRLINLLSDKSIVFIDSAILFTIDTNKSNVLLQPQGVWRIRDGMNKKIMSIGEYSNGKMHGHSISFYSNGGIAHSFYYNNGISSGPSISFWGNGAPMMTAYYQNGLVEGLVRNFDTSGRLIKLAEYKQNKQEGIEIKVYLSGNIKLVTNYSEGEENGIRREYLDNESFELRGEFEMKNSVPISGRIYENGKLRQILNYNYEDEKRKRDEIKNHKGDGTFTIKEMLSDP